MTAPQAKMTIKIAIGITDQVISKADEPSICSAFIPARRRYLVANTRIMAKMAAHINADRASRKMKSASTFPAPVEARMGQSGKLSNIKLVVGRWSSVVGQEALSSGHGCRWAHTEHEYQECPQNQHRRARGQLQDSTDDGPVFPGVRIVVVAVEQDLVDHCADLVLGCLNQSQAQIFRCELDAVIVLSDFSFGRQHHDCGRMSELAALGIVLILEAGRFGECID